MADETEHTEPTGAPDAHAGLVPGPSEPPPLSADKAFAGKAKELHALRDAVVDAASVGAGLWFSIFLFFHIFSSPLAP